MSAVAGQRDADRITLGQGRALIAAGQWAGMSAHQLGALMVGVTGAEHPEALTRKGWLDLMNRFVSAGFRHPAVPMVTPLQLAVLDDMRRFLGLDGRTFVDLVREVGGARWRRQLGGRGFLDVWAWLARHGADVPVPCHGFMTREMVRALHEGAHQQSMDADMFLSILAEVGGVLRASQLDEQAFVRLVLHFKAHGFARPPLAPGVAGDLGMVTQAQANLVWRLWLDFGGWKGDTSQAALDAAIGSMFGMEGGVASLTRAGARAVIDRFMVPRMNDRRAAEGAGGPPDGEPPARQGHDGRRRARRGQKGGRR